MAKQLKRFLRLPQLKAMTGNLPTSSIYDMMAKDEFPKPVHLSPQRVAWLEDEVAEWQAKRIAQRDQASALKPPSNDPSTSIGPTAERNSGNGQCPPLQRQASQRRRRNYASGDPNSRVVHEGAPSAAKSAA